MGWRHDNDYIYLPSFFNQILQEKEYNFLFAAESAGLNSITHDSELAIIQRTFFFQWFQVNKLMVFYDWLLCPAPNRRGIKQCFCLTSVCLSRTSGLSREQRPRKTKIGTEVAHVTRSPLSRSKGQGSRSPGRFTHCRVGASGSCSGGHGNVLAVRNCCHVAVCSAVQAALAPTGGGEGRGYIVAATRLQLVKNNFNH